MLATYFKSTAPIHTSITPIPEPSAPSSQKPLRERLIAKLDQYESKLDQALPNFLIQNKIDRMLKEIDTCFSDTGFTRYNNWINDSGNGTWYVQLATFLAKLPLKAARNILQMLAQLIHGTLKAVIYTAAHPLKAPAELAKWIIALAHELSKPETWTKIGVGLMGSHLGYIAVTPNPVSPLFLAIGGTMALAGISAGALKAALAAKKGHRLDAACAHLSSQPAAIAEEMATGLCLGFLIGGIQQAIRGIRQSARNDRYRHEVDNARYNLAKRQAEEFARQHNFPQSDRFSNTDTHVKLYWEVDKAHFYSFPTDLPDTTFLMDKLITGYDTTYYIQSYVTKVVDGASITTPIYGTIYTPIYSTFVGYKFPLTGWQAPPRPPALPPVGNLSNRVVLPLSLATATPVPTNG